MHAPETAGVPWSVYRRSAKKYPLMAPLRITVVCWAPRESGIVKFNSRPRTLGGSKVADPTELERAARIELASSGWRPGALPLDEARIMRRLPQQAAPLETARAWRTTGSIGHAAVAPPRHRAPQAGFEPASSDERGIWSG